MTITIDSVVERWTGKERPLFKGSLITGDGTPDDPVCYCAQGDVLHLAGWTDAKIRMLEQSKADAEVASILGISRGHSVLLRIVNDRKDGCPQDVLTNPEKVIGDQAQTVLAFYRRIDRMAEADWKQVYAAWDAARAAARAAAQGAAGEIMGARIMREKNQPFYFLPMFGFATPEEVLAADAAQEGEANGG